MLHLSTAPLWAIVNAFAALGAVAGVLVTRQPEVFRLWALTRSDWGWVLFAAGLGGVLAYPVNRWVLAHWGSRRMLFRFGTAGGFLLALVPWLPALPGLLAGTFLQGAIYSGVGVAINHQASELELRQGLRVMGRLHATFFVGGVLSALLSSLCGALGVSLAIHMAGVGLLVAWLHRSAAVSLDSAFACAAAAVPEPPHGIGEGRGLGLLFGWCMVLEGGVMGWASVYLNQGLKASEGLSGIGLAVFSGAMAIGRLLSDGLVARYGAARLVRSGAAVCALALVSAAALHRLPVALVAFAATGLGLAAAAPTIFSAAGRRSGDAVAFVAGMGAIGGLLGPLVLGRIASGLSLDWVLAALAAVALVITWRADALAERGSVPGGCPPRPMGSTHESA